MNDSEMISIIVPIYNTERYIRKCVNSIQNQTYKNLEIILVNDGSKDNSKNIMNQLAKEDSRIKVIHKQNAGVTAARLDGIKKASGEYIGFVDSDDVIEKDMYEILLDNMLKYNADISHCGYQMVFPDGRKNQFYGTGKIKKQSCEVGQIDLLEGDIIEPGLCNKLYRKQLFDGLDMDLSIKINEDLLMNFYLFQKSKKSVFYDVCKYHYLVREGSTSRSALNKHKIYDPILVKKIICEKSDGFVKEIAKHMYVITCINVYHSLITTEHKNIYCEDEKKVRDMIRTLKTGSNFSKKNIWMILGIIYMPFLYKIVYCIYAKYIQKSKYD